MRTLPLIPSSPWSRALVPALGLLAIGAGFLCTDVEELHAHIGSKLGPDGDGDGLADSQEYLLGTDPDERDTDGDGFHDLEEVARHSDPNLASSVPNTDELSVAIYSYEEFGFLNMHTAIYVADGAVGGLNFEFGVVINGTPVPVSRGLLNRGARVFNYRGVNDPDDKLLVLEMPIPEGAARQLGDLHTYSRLQDDGPAQRQPAVDTSSLININGNFMEAQPAPPGVNGGQGMIFQSVAGPSSPPQGTVGGQVCWQDVEPVGANGANLLFEVKSAACEDFDSYCDSSSCTASVGGVLEVPDPGGLIGG